MTIKVVITSDPASADLFAEIHSDDQPWAEIVLDPLEHRFVLRIYPLASNKPFAMPLKDVESAISQAKAELGARGYVES